jgi:hypothetical protein
MVPVQCIVPPRRLAVAGVKNITYVTPQGIASVPVLPMAAAEPLVKSEPRKKAQRDLEKK